MRTLMGGNPWAACCSHAAHHSGHHRKGRPVKRVSRTAGTLFLAHIVLLLAGYSQQRSPLFGDSPATVVSTYAGVPATKMYVGGFLVVLSWLALLGGVTLAAQVLRSRGLSVLTVVAGAAAAVVTLAGADATAGAAYYAATHGYSPDVVAGLNLVSKFSDFIAMSASGLCALGFGAAVLAGRALPRWMGWLSLIVGVVGIASGSSTAVLNIGTLLWLAWLVLASAVLLKGPKSVVTAPAPAVEPSLATADLS